MGELPKNLNIPNQEIYRVCLLNEEGQITQTYVFDKMSKENNELFSKDEIDQYGEILHSSNQIHKDDSIHHIKQKIVHELNVNNKNNEDMLVCYDEIYMFVDVGQPNTLMNIYQSVTKKETIPFNSRQLKQLLKNIHIKETDIERMISDLKNSEFILYEDLDLKLLESIPSFHTSIPLGQKWEKDPNYLFSSNPYNLFSKETGSLGVGGSQLITFENDLLFNYGNIMKQTIYVCLTKDVVSHTDKLEINAKDSIRTYFPFLFNKDILSIDDLMTNKESLIQSTKKGIKNVLPFFKTVDMFYDLYNSKTEELSYKQQGIDTFHIRIKSEFQNILPLEVVFKNIHATKQTPFIKYNPGNRRENIYRLYTEQKTRDGKHIPILSETSILRLSKEIGKPKEISFYIQHLENEKEAPLLFYIDIDINGDIHIRSELKTPLRLSELTQLLKKIINPVIDNINSFLEKTGYKIRLFDSFQDSFIEVVDMNYITQYAVKKWDLTKYENCISSIFDIINEDMSNMQFKRVANFREMDAQSVLIREIYKQTNDMYQAVLALMKNYHMTEEEAKRRIAKYTSENEIIRGKIIDNPGFPVQFKKENEMLTITVSNIISIHYLDTLFIYIDSILRITQILKLKERQRIEELCKSHIQWTESTIDNVITTNKTFQKPTLENIEEYDEAEGIYYSDEEDEEEVEGIYHSDDEEGEQEKEDEEEEEEEEGIYHSDEEEEEEEKQDEVKKDEVKKDEVKKETEETEDEDEDEGIFHSDEEEEEAEEESGSAGNETKGKETKGKETKGGAGSDDEEDNDNDTEEIDIESRKKELIGKSLTNPTIFFESMKQREPTLFVTEEDGNYEGYSRTCPSSDRRQPIILTKSELDKIDKGSYSEAVKYGSDKNNPYYYICPRYWCLLTNTSMEDKDIKAGKCSNNENGTPDKIIPKNATSVPKDAFVYEFNHPKQHHRKGSDVYVENHPGFIVGKHPNKKLALPCCFKKAFQNWEGYHLPEDEKVIPQKKVAKKKKAIEENETLMYIISNETFPIKQANRFGFLPISIQLFFQINSNDYVTDDNRAIIKPNVKCMLRYGVEQYPKQSILGSIADLYAYSQKLKETPSVAEFKEIMANSITLDQFIKYNNSYLVSVFKPKTIPLDKIIIDDYKDTEFYKQLDIDNEYQKDFLIDTIAAYLHFLDFIKNKNSVIDHTYLWDIVTSPNEKLIKNGVNLIILEIVDNDITNNIKILCPTNSHSSNIYVSSKETMILIKKNEYYEPIYMYEDVDNEIQKTRVFYKDSIAIQSMKHILQMIEKTILKCASKPSLPKIYKFKKNILLNELVFHLTTHHYDILNQIMNYQGKIIGVVAQQKRDEEQEQAPNNSPVVFVPCYPSASLIEYPIKMMDDEEASIWNTYDITMEQLTILNQISKGKILSKPALKVIEDKNLIVGIITETNQFIQIDPPVYKDKIEDDLPILSLSNYIEADKVITTSNKEDDDRVKMVKMISLESQFYSLFRSTIRNLLNEHEFKHIKSNIISIFDNSQMMYKDKIKQLIVSIKKLAQRKIVFNEIDEKVLMKYDELSCFESNCGQSNYCIRKQNGKCSLSIPKYNLINGNDNEQIYFGRIADELLRYKRIQLFMIQPKQYLNITNVDYKINNDEFILIQSLLDNQYLKKISYNTSTSNEIFNYSNAQPQISQAYANPAISLDQQKQAIHANNEELVNDEMYKCIETKKDIIGNQTSIWKRIFSKTSQEIIFKKTHNDCSFYPLIYVFENKYKKKISIVQIKSAIWNGYKRYTEKFNKKIMDILKQQGKEKIVTKIQKDKNTLETIIMSEEYYITDLDIWIFSEIAQIQICLFSANGLSGINKDMDWLMCRQKYNEPCYFIRSPAIQKNKSSSYNVIEKPYVVNELGEFNVMLQNAQHDTEYTKNIMTLQEYLA